MSLLAIGSVIRNKGIDLVITGYHLAEEERSYQLYYIVSLFPIGYMPGQAKSQGFFPVNKDCEVVFEGYRDEYCEKYLARIAARAERLKDMDPKVMNLLLTETIKRMEAKNQ